MNGATVSTMSALAALLADPAISADSVLASVPMATPGSGSVVRDASETVYGVVVAHGRWMVWNTALALVPLGLAMRLFQIGRTRTRAWWFGLVVFVLFLPNAPYVLSDVIHFFGDVRATRGDQDLRVMFGVFPVYAMFFATGFGAYVACVRRVRRYVSAELGAVAARNLALVLHGLVSVGLFLGRFWRFNSWDLVSTPDSFAYRLDDVMHRFPLAVIGVTFVLLVTFVTLVELAIDGLEYRRRSGRSLLL